MLYSSFYYLRRRLLYNSLLTYLHLIPLICNFSYSIINCHSVIFIIVVTAKYIYPIQCTLEADITCIFHRERRICHPPQYLPNFPEVEYMIHTERLVQGLILIPDELHSSLHKAFSHLNKHFR